MSRTPKADQAQAAGDPPRVKRAYNRKKPTAKQLAAQQAQAEKQQASQAAPAPAPAPAPAAAKPKFPQVDATPEFLSDLRHAAFVLETVAHMRGMTAEYLPIADRFRAIISSK
jgi:hypothetical protein